MSDDKSIIYKALYNWVSTPNGRLSLLGTVMILGSNWVVFQEGFDNLTFVYVVMIMGSVFLTLSILLAVLKAQKEDERELKIMELDHLARTERRQAGEADRTVYDWKRRADD